MFAFLEDFAHKNYLLKIKRINKCADWSGCTKVWKCIKHWSQGWKQILAEHNTLQKEQKFTIKKWIQVIQRNIIIEEEIYWYR